MQYIKFQGISVKQFQFMQFDMNHILEKPHKLKWLKVIHIQLTCLCICEGGG